MLPITIRKKIINKDDLLIIQAVANKHWDTRAEPISQDSCVKNGTGCNLMADLKIWLVEKYC